MVDFSKLKSQSGKKSFEAITGELAKFTNPEGRKGDDRFWQPTVDKAGNGYAVIRFLPAPGEEDVPFVRMWSHGFKGPTGQWYIENSLTTLGQGHADPVSELNSKMWNSVSGEGEVRDQVRKQKRQLNFISNIYVVSDSGNPENDGKVFLFKYGKKIFDKVNAAMNPEFEDEVAINPFDLWKGANFKLKIRKVEGYRNYDKSEFDTVRPLLDDDAELEKIWKSEYSLQDFLKPENFKSYAELKARLAIVLPQMNASAAAESTPWAGEKEAAAAPIRAQSTPADDDGDGDEDEHMALFKSLSTKR